MIYYMISYLPVELQNKIYSYVGEHPIATMFRQEIPVSEYYDTRGFIWKVSREFIRETELNENIKLSDFVDKRIWNTEINTFRMRK